jgi:hypothetical protein
MLDENSTRARARAWSSSEPVFVPHHAVLWRAIHLSLGRGTGRNGTLRDVLRRLEEKSHKCERAHSHSTILKEWLNFIEIHSCVVVENDDGKK